VSNIYIYSKRIDDRHEQANVWKRSSNMTDDIRYGMRMEMPLS
jgi:hypothetical protein